MKILNRPMFRMGGPIKEGIMNGIQEPKRGRVDGPGSYGGDEAKIFANVEKEYIPNVKSDQYYKEQANIRNKPINEFFTDSFIKDEINKKNLIGKYDPENDGVTSLVPFSKSNKMPYIGNDGLSYTDRFVEDYKLDKRSDILANEQEYFENYKEKNYGDKIELQKNLLKKYNPNDPRLKLFDTKRLRGTSGAPGGGDPEMYAKSKTIDEVIEQKPVVNDPELTKKQKTDNILEMLGYDKAKKNALYDAMINAGQRISRTGLGADNLVSDVIADTSRSYDKPEKLREAANLMRVQQDLKLDQIAASKTGGATAQNYQYFLDRGYDEKTASRKAEGLATNLLEAKSIGVEKQKLQGDKLTEYVAQSLIGMNNDDFENAEYKGTINSKDHKTVSEFAASTDFGGAGVYTVKGRVIELDGNGNILTEQIVSSSTTDKKWWNLSD